MESRQQHSVPVWSGAALEGIRAACAAGRRILDKAHAAVRPGITTDEIDRIVSDALLAGPPGWEFGGF